ncbi:hypothetical protein GQ43DRAFT_250615 [Delitschia confertaspora ATCC 74209]|uniref:Uncharacterized protein n=1 Tax=Delitschia confertaspora ATCC 74209 TaxID=1513339 RepID=A0A9P4JG29_9PLEO|nr:hypothetical protein GQ43DRAFT_250615 [Delitschia confertaspora ATCC 74209]
MYEFVVMAGLCFEAARNALKLPQITVGESQGAPDELRQSSSSLCNSPKCCRGIYYSCQQEIQATKGTEFADTLEVLAPLYFDQISHVRAVLQIRRRAPSNRPIPARPCPGWKMRFSRAGLGYQHSGWSWHGGTRRIPTGRRLFECQRRVRRRSRAIGVFLEAGGLREFVLESKDAEESGEGVCVMCQLPL